MWYVMQVTTGREQHVVDQIQRMVPQSLYQELSIPRYQVKKKYRGQWQVVTERLFPGYVFVRTRKPETLAGELRTVPSLTKILASKQENNETSFVPLARAELQLLQSLLNPETRVVDMSEGIIEGDRIVVTKGPLVGKMAMVKKVDRHKRLAYLEFKAFGRVMNVKVGLEVVGKS